VAELTERAKEYTDKASTPADCRTLTAEEIDAILATVAEQPLEDVTIREIALLETTHGTMVFAFFPDSARVHVQSFKRLVKTGFYDCTNFHRVMRGFVIQGGDILTRDAVAGNDGSGNPGYNLPAEFNGIAHDKGVLSMARGQQPDTAGSQFFICLSREGTRNLDGRYTVFGLLVGGFDVLDRIAAVKTRPNNYGEPSVPVEPVTLLKAHWLER
jgi:cyclophilin family peptidyl-prolyl cis-trans isomerase